jgi:hypothetical protein
MSGRNWSLLCVALLSACVTHPFDENSRFSAIPTGSGLVLNQTIEIAPDQVAVYMQDGKLMAHAAMNHYRLHCKFEIYTMADVSRQVEPDIFTVIRVVDESDLVSLQLLPTASLTMVMGDAGPGIVTDTTVIYLKSEKQPDVYRMSCMQWNDVSQQRYPSINEMRKAMGKIFSLKIANPPASKNPDR